MSMTYGYCAGPFKEFSEDDLYERYLRIQAEKKKELKETETAIIKK